MTMGKKIIFAVFVAAIAFTSANVTAEESTQGHGSDEHNNVLGLFVGISNSDDWTNEPALGIEYVRHIAGNFSIGAIAEHTFGDADSWVYAIPFAYSLGHWKTYVAPGIEDGHHGQEDLVRLGVERVFELSDGWEIAPQLNVDFVDGEETWVVGGFFSRRY
jgi:hypothetical protein